MDEIITNEQGTTPVQDVEVESTPNETEQTTDTPQDGGTPAEEGTNAVVDDNVVFAYNHEDVSVGKDEAKRLAQIGYHYEKVGKNYNADLKSIMADLDFFASVQGKTIKDVVKGMVDGIANGYREELEAQLGEGNPLIDEMVEVKMGKHRKTYEDALGARAEAARQEAENASKSASEKLAEQFEGLKAVFPEIDSVDKIPESVLKEAAKSGDLEKEMLRYQLNEQRKIQAEKENQNQNNKQNVGSQQSTPAEDNAISAMMKGLWG
jgi:hypothetical protein